MIIKSLKETKGGEQVSIDLTGIKNPRSTSITGPFSIETFDKGGAHVIDRGFDITTQMQELWPIDNFQVKIETDPVINGAKETYIFTLSTTLPL